MEIFLIRVLQFMLAISLLVLLHEGGHFFFAKLFGVRVEKFYLFFDPYFHLFEFKPKNSETTYGMGWLPLGGYCKIAGMIDESFDTEQMKQPEQPWEFRSKPAWQRLLIMIGGVLVNFLLALFIYSMILFHWGDTYVPVKDMTMGMKFNSEAKQLGFRDGDILVGTEKGEFKDFSADLFRDISEAHRVDVLRNGKPVSIQLKGDLNLLNMLKTDPKFVLPLMPALVDSVEKGSPADQIGMRKGDKIVAVNGKEIDSYNAYIDIIGRLKDQMSRAKTSADSLRLRQATLVLERNGQRDTASVVLKPDLKLGYFNPHWETMYKPVTRTFGFFESFPAGIKYGWHVLVSYVDDMKYVFTADGAKSLGGFGAIGSLFPPTWDWYMFWKMTAFLSIILAFMNILPIPALDGGHVLFLLYEMITRRKPSETFMIRAEYIGFGILILLMVVANLNDVLRILGYL
ncbi:MAG: RIP metalloprotease RseP [Prevotella sp.]|nr:RIP metalloprotease RseP [Prevotella sp.]